ncbi:hypothetical protein [Streptomyces flaveus]|uniref:Uncharacterized protein n=1 Tax=Streptomyces flaveus TaxID=66370 RepID=A0A917QP95_9ACTN|nr:hypothetical protein [Streptomyces flaveus]GGK60071.1 hypothetical protein GCM10010094_20530 [Streptomyces flaveus]
MTNAPRTGRAILEVVPANNPRPVTHNSLQRLLRAAWQGADPLTRDGEEHQRFFRRAEFV